MQVIVDYYATSMEVANGLRKLIPELARNKSASQALTEINDALPKEQGRVIIEVHISSDNSQERAVTDLSERVISTMKDFPAVKLVGTSKQSASKLIRSDGMLDDPIIHISGRTYIHVARLELSAK